MGTDAWPIGGEFESQHWIQDGSFLTCFCCKMAIPCIFFVYFRLFKQTLQFLEQINVKNVHAEYGAGIQTHDLQNMSLLP